MNSNLPYPIDVAIAITIFYMAYLLLFSKEKMFAFNRTYLITSMLVSFIIPLITFTEYVVMPATIEVTEIGISTTSDMPVTSPSQVFFGISLQQLPELLFFSGFVLFLTILITGHIKVLMIIKKSSRQSLYGYSILVTQEDIPPFTYFNKLIIPTKIINTPHIQSVIHHENIHKKELHCIDLFLTEITFLFQWFNPFAWLMRKSIRDNLEFLTDEKVTDFIDKQEYQLGIISLAGKNAFYTFPSLSNQSQLKKRIIMMKTNNQSKVKWIRTLVIIPMLAIMTVTLSGRDIQIIYPDTETKGIALTENAPINIVDDNKNTNVPIIPTGSLGFNIFQDLDQASIEKYRKDDKSKVMVIKTKTSNMAIVKNNTDERLPLIIIDDKRHILGKANLIQLDPRDFESFTVLKDKTATELYGEEGKNGVIIITTKSENDKQNAAVRTPNNTTTQNTIESHRKEDSIFIIKKSANELINSPITVSALANSPMIVIDDKKYTTGEAKLTQLDPNDIESFSVLKKQNAITIYGEEGKNGVIIITTKKQDQLK